ncbi:MAG: translocation/assembly module TamB [Treponema sp.]|nr:translocation/assembly module TamB [Treponema sp.]
MQNTIQESTGLNISYKSFSPSILNQFEIYGIELTDKEGNLVGSINKLIINYRLFSLIKGDYQRFVRNVVIDGIKVDLKRTLDIVTALSENPDSEAVKVSDDSNELTALIDDFASISEYIPSNIEIKNVELFYEDENVDALVSISNVVVLNSTRRKSLELTLGGKGRVLVKPMDMLFTTNLLMNGTIYDNLENSSVHFSISDFTNGEYKLNKLNFLATYADNVFDVHSVQSVNPFYVGAKYDYKNNIAEASVKTDNLDPLTLFTTSNKEIKDLIRDFRLSVTADVKYEIDEDKLSYDSNGRVYVPANYVPGGANVSYNLAGDLDKLKLKYLNVTGDMFDVGGNLDLTFKNLQLSGLLDLRRFSLPNGKIVSSEINFHSMSKGFFIASPKVVIGEKELTSMLVKVIPQNDSVDFEFEVSDYISSEENPDDVQVGVISIDGSYLTASNYFQTNVSLNSLSVLSVLQYVQQLVDSETAQTIAGLEDFAAPYIFTGDVYASSDFDSVSFNVPYVLVANTKEDNQYLFLSANGNEQNIQINRFDLILGNYAINLVANLTRLPDSNEMFFDVGAVASSIPYNFNGTYVDNVITVSGDYGVNCQVRLNKDSVDGELIVENLPLPLENGSYILSTDSAFTYSSANGPEVQLTQFVVEKSDITSVINPKLMIGGTITKYGAQLSTIGFSDMYSNLEGEADITVNMDEGIFNSAGISLALKSTTAEERINLEAAVSNPDGVELNSDTIMNNLYINSQLDFNNFGLSRFTSQKNDSNELSASLFLTGTLEHPYAALTLRKLSMLISNDIMTAKGMALLEDRDLSINELNFTSRTWGINNITGNFSIDQLEGELKGLFNLVSSDQDLEIPLNVRLHDAYFAEDSLAPESVTVTVSSDNVGGTMMNKNVGFEVSVIYTPDVISVFSSDNIGLVGTYLPETGEVFGSIDSEGVMMLDVGGTAQSDNLNIQISNIDINLKNLLSYFKYDDSLKVENGNLKGDLLLQGNFDTPDLFGELRIDSPRCYLPSLFKNVVSAKEMKVTALHNEITLEKQVYSLKNTPKFNMDGKIVLDKWAPDYMSLSISSLKNDSIPLEVKSEDYTFIGEVAGNLDIFVEDNIMDVTGKLYGENINFDIPMPGLGDLTSSSDSDSDVPDPDEMTLRTNLDITFGTHVIFSYSPILRAVFVPNTHIFIKTDDSTDLYEVSGELKIKSGDINYLRRNFYIKEGNIKFNGEDITNPIVSIAAETREKDSTGQNIRIILSAENQYLSELNPKFSSDPPKSENEILSLLGQVILADAKGLGDIVATAGEYWLQSTVMREIENKLRDLLNFDIFSIRTNVLQNTINLSNAGLLTNENITIGNFLDNSTVYIGKYLGSNLYVDAMLHLSLEDGDVTDISSAKGLLFKPEFGLELELPIANIRWNMAPDINALMNNQYVPSTSLSLSWKFNF